MTLAVKEPNAVLVAAAAAAAGVDYREPESTTETPPSLPLQEYGGVAGGGGGGHGPRQDRDHQDIKDAMQQILWGRDIDDVLKGMEEGPPSTSPMRDAAVAGDNAARDTTERDNTQQDTTQQDTTPDIITANELSNRELEVDVVVTEQLEGVVETSERPSPTRPTRTSSPPPPTRPTRISSPPPPTRTVGSPVSPHRTPAVTNSSANTTALTTVLIPPPAETGATMNAAAREGAVEYYSDEEVPPPDAAGGLRAQESSPHTMGPRTSRRYFDIPVFLEIIKNLTADYDTDLVQQVNKTLKDRWKVGPTCPDHDATSTTPHTTTTVEPMDYSQNMTGTIMGKEKGIPNNASCSDAFAGDFLPLGPVDATARGKIGKFRKYCRFMDIQGFHYNVTDPRSLWGPWTGGCAVRWLDLSGVYTQRTCRNRHRAIVGRHFVSKRMAKLEMALQDMDNGCITSPAASLIPLSRGVNLYARFMACVCTGNWCNGSPARRPPPRPLLVLVGLALYSTHS